MPNAAPDDDIELRMARRTRPPYWWPDSNVVMQLFLAVSIVGIVAYIIHQLLSGEALKIDQSVRDLVVFIFGIVFGNFKDVFGYTFGSSAGQKKQGEAITKSLEDKDKIIADNVSTAAALAATTVSSTTTDTPTTIVTTAPTEPSSTPTTTTVTTQDPAKDAGKTET